MKISWLGHASFLLESSGKKLICDPFDENVGYALIEEEVDIVTVSHEHWDHNATDKLAGNPVIVRGTGDFDIDNFKIKGFPSFHDKVRGEERGMNTMYRISVEGINLLHLGDLGHLVSPEECAVLGKIDILMIPVGGVYTINADEAYQIVQALNPQIVIPMHFKTPHLCFDLAPVEEFNSKFDSVVKKSYLEINLDKKHEQTGVIVLDYI